MNEFELVKEKIDNDILMLISEVGTKNTYKEFHTLIEGDLSDEICNEIVKHYKNRGWEYAYCESSKTYNERTKDEWNPDRRYNRTGLVLRNFNNKKLHISDVMFNSIYDCGKCKLIPKEYKQHMIDNGMLDVVLKHIHLFED